MNSVFSEQILTDKLSKLNSTQQCIETLSHWCIFHRSKAELVVSTWEKQFKSSQTNHKVPLLYLANDILQNSKRKGNEFVSEFWNVLPSALKEATEKGDEHMKTVAARLVNIWEERRVFGSREFSIKDLMLGEGVLLPLEFNKKRQRSIRIVKRDSRSIRTKLSIGGAAEKIISAYYAVLTEQPVEDAEMSKCKSAIHRMKKIDKNVDVVCANVNDPNRQTLAKELEDDESILKQCIEKLKLIEACRLALVSQLRETIHEQESGLEIVRTQMQVAEAQIVEANNMRNRLADDNYVAVPKAMASTANANGNGQPMKKSAATIAAEVADKLAASSSSQMIMASVLSTFAAEEAKNAGFENPSTAPDLLASLPPGSVGIPTSHYEQTSDMNVFASLSAPPNHPYQTVLLPQQNHNPVSQPQTVYHLLPNPTPQQYIQSPGSMMNPYAYGNVPPLPPGPPPPPMAHLVSQMMPLPQQNMQIGQHQVIPVAQMHISNQAQSVTLGQQFPIPPSFRPLQPSAFYSHSHQP